MFAHLTQVMNAVERAGGHTYKSQPSKPESHVESVTSIFPSPPTMPKKVTDSRPYTVDRAPLTSSPSPEGKGEAEPKQTQRA